MPVLKNAKKKLKQDKKRAKQNKALKSIYKQQIKKARIEKTKKSISSAYSGIDKAAKNNIIHKNKAARMKSSIAKLISKPSKPA